MAVTFISAGSAVNAFNSTMTPAAGTYATGDALIYITGEHQGNDSQTAPAGWNQLSINSTITEVTIWGRIAQSSSETIPGVNWGAVNRGAAFVAAFRGLDTSFTSVMTGTSERTATTTANIVMGASAKTPTQDGALCICAGVRNKTAATDGNTFTKPSGWDAMIQSFANNGASNAFQLAAAYWIQPTATSVIANTTISTTSGTDASGQSMAGTMIFLAPAASGGGGGGGTGTITFPPPKRKTYVFYDNYYPR